jgi:hypothetical protein
MTLGALKTIKAGKSYPGDVALDLAIILIELPRQPVQSNDADEGKGDDDNNSSNSKTILL